MDRLRRILIMIDVCERSGSYSGYLACTIQLMAPKENVMSRIFRC